MMYIFYEVNIAVFLVKPKLIVLWWQKGNH